MSAVAIPAINALTQLAGSRARSRSAMRSQTALLLSGGGNLAFFHVGVIKVLLESGMLPNVISGTSAGSVMAALVCTRPDRELKKLHEDQLSFIGFTEKDRSQRYTSEQFEAELGAILPDLTFAEAAARTGRALNISLAAPGGGGVVCGPRTTPDALIRDAVRASCAVPFVFEPVVVRERRRGRLTPFHSGQGWVDGCLFADVPEKLIKEQYNVDHAVVSLVNPAVRPFISDRPRAGARHQLRTAFFGAAKSAALSCAQMAKMTVGWGRTGDMLDTVCRVMDQAYSGDIVLTPSRRFVVSDLMDHPSAELVNRLIVDGEARTRSRLHELHNIGSDPVRVADRGALNLNRLGFAT